MRSNRIDRKARGAVLTRLAKSKAMAPEATLRIGGAPKTLVAEFGGDRRLEIGNAQIACYVLSNGSRVVALEGLQQAIGWPICHGARGAHRLADFVASVTGKDDPDGVVMRLRNPIVFTRPQGGREHGYDAFVLPDVCRILRRAADSPHMPNRYIPMLCEEILHDLYHRPYDDMDVIVDEASGYDQHWSRWQISKSLARYIDTEVGVWVGTFPFDYFRQLSRLKGENEFGAYPDLPPGLGEATNDLVYRRLSWQALAELRKAREGMPARVIWKHLDDDALPPLLRMHVWGLLALMRASDNWATFARLVERAFPVERHDPPIPRLADEDKKSVLEPASSETKTNTGAAGPAPA